MSSKAANKDIKNGNTLFHIACPVTFLLGLPFCEEGKTHFAYSLFPDGMATLENRTTSQA